MSHRLLWLSLSILIGLLFWIVLDTYHAYRETFLPTVSDQETQDLNPGLDSSVLKMLKRK